jgi:hypothetical protein
MYLLGTKGRVDDNLRLGVQNVSLQRPKISMHGAKKIVIQFVSENFFSPDISP